MRDGIYLCDPATSDGETVLALQAGRFTLIINSKNDTSYCITKEGGEAMAISPEQLEQMLAEYFEKNF